ncbi:hypothetical protein AgCh_030364 [Apium graveolens]
MSNNEGKQNESKLWYLDNGTSNQMSGKKLKFHVLDEGIAGVVRFGDDSTVKIKGKRSIIFRCINGGERTLDEVYYIPSFHSNITNLGQLSEDGNKVMLMEEYMWVYDKEEKLLMKIERNFKAMARPARTSKLQGYVNDVQGENGQKLA